MTIAPLMAVATVAAATANTRMQPSPHLEEVVTRLTSEEFKGVYSIDFIGIRARGNYQSRVENVINLSAIFYELKYQSINQK